MSNSKEWYQAHNKDPYVKLARKNNYRSRAVYKLSEIDSKFKLFKNGKKVVDLGAAPGSWSQYIAKKIQPSGKLVAIDLLPISAIDGVKIIEGDFNSIEVQNSIRNEFIDKCDIAVSDLAVNLSGVAIVDQQAMSDISTAMIEFCAEILTTNGILLLKSFTGECGKEIQAALKSKFKSINLIKPKASKSNSREIYYLARNLKL